ncbi:cytochrome P450 [Stackebrandtia nassauensis]|uniref:Cytochrome P450 n=1 Tax=Stackebrandtia nassauensis (strain DSM 44728 / CIP 108903 / NRRL B-16338 / NBRC 102104 / LLR-40K-21) TaxID=446470 RepID=D3Q3P3_STANL|nr:cytochrome P450 [Stackebrandtia nassauensis]ADD43960.1 cytochrome P450 [Stackebrandtia nassauensis DSM 44728]
MTGRSTPLTALPMTRAEGRPFDPPPLLARLRDEAPLRRLTYADGHQGWLATGHEEVRTLLGDNRISPRPDLIHLPFELEGITTLPAPAPGAVNQLDGPDHARLRQPLVGWFTVRRMRQLTHQVETLVADLLDDMADRGPDVDLVDEFAYPLPVTVVCDLLGVPESDRATFRDLVTTSGRSDLPIPDRLAANEQLGGYVGELVAAKRARPADDIISALTETDLDDTDVVGLSAFLISAGFDTTANMLALGTMALLEHPSQLAAWRADPGITNTAVEELMRYLSIVHTTVHSAVDDIEIAGQTIKAGDSVTLSFMAANRDPRKFPDPDRLDLRRNATGHLGFTHGAHACLGQQLARVEMRAAFPALLRRFPNLRLNIAIEDVPLRDPLILVYGLDRLPVTLT